MMMNEVKEDNHYIADFGYGGSDFRHLWAEPEKDQASALYLDASFEKAFKIDDVSSVFHYELIAENGGLDSYMTEGKGELRCSDFDEILHEDIITNLPLAVSISHASEDHYLDVDFAKKVPDLDCQFCDEWNADSLRSEINSPGTSDEEVGASESSILPPQCLNDQIVKITSDEMPNDSGGDSRYQRPVEDKMDLKCSLLCDIQDAQDTNDVRNTLEVGSSFAYEGKKAQFCITSVKSPYTSICTHDEVGELSQGTKEEDFCVDDLSPDSCAETEIVRVRQRRLCRPPQRYLDGSPLLKSRLHRGKKPPTSMLKDEDLGAESQNKHCRKGLEIKASKTWARNLEHETDDEYEPVESSFNIRKSKRNDRRKNCKPWTLDEVVALVDGMSKFGIGQWTAVKKAFFSSSRRTATDIRDKWRNLVKTKCRSSNGRKDDQQRNGVQPLPKPVIERVRELASAPVVKCRSKSGRKLSGSRCSDMTLFLAE
ncbi:hypothetical protein BVRB_7g162030 [Beta vulgaris subsp. vulgaris]|uniref:uncharacterized protein LOC104898683 n=1 Tax=Beta vulgaris subsp. vulgaris TaxID=3555 RepID=UPI00053FB307|nr:uncharacterized protein LOC104898683 [Beta vulgaris subsp. vulgaris]KMT06278.1 hypothetical protein BVRB_7g162030 [Beta vulgaris subsp. vulgaris]